MDNTRPVLICSPRSTHLYRRLIESKVHQMLKWYHGWNLLFTWYQGLDLFFCGFKFWKFITFGILRYAPTYLLIHALISFIHFLLFKKTITQERRHSYTYQLILHYKQKACHNHFQITWTSKNFKIFMLPDQLPQNRGFHYLELVWPKIDFRCCHFYMGSPSISRICCLEAFKFLDMSLVVKVNLNQLEEKEYKTQAV